MTTPLLILVFIIVIIIVGTLFRSMAKSGFVIGLFLLFACAMVVVLKLVAVNWVVWCVCLIFVVILAATTVFGYFNRTNPLERIRKSIATRSTLGVSLSSTK